MFFSLNTAQPLTHSFFFWSFFLTLSLLGKKPPLAPLQDPGFTRTETAIQYQGDPVFVFSKSANTFQETQELTKSIVWI